MMQTIKQHIGQRSYVRLGWHWCKSFAAALYYGFPAKKLQVIGITGTDGKTTTVGMLHHILQTNGITCSALSTAFIKINQESQWNHTEKTSPNPFVIQKFLYDAYKAGSKCAILEVSSHGLVQHRLNWTWPTIAAITNISLEHLDYHKTMAQYIVDKGLLFAMLPKNGTCVLNKDDETYKFYSASNVRAIKTYSVQVAANATFCATDIQESTGIKCRITDTDHKQRAELELQIPGTFNVENALCAITCASACGIRLIDAVLALRTFKNAPGRMEQIIVGQPFTVYIDFTVTPQAFIKTLTALRAMLPTTQNKIHVLTGSCGDRMPEKRPEIGRICCELADTLVVTDDEPYTEDPTKIRAEILTGTDEGICSIKEIADRTEAMRYIFTQAKPGDIVLLCGLGSYPTRMFGTKLIPWNEQEIATELLAPYSV